MRKLFTFTFEGNKKAFNRKYSFDTIFDGKSSYERTLDWAETTEDIALFKEKMDTKYGYNEIVYNPRDEFYGLYSNQTQHQDYISVVQDWKSFLTQHKIKCGNIIELIEDNAV